MSQIQSDNTITFIRNNVSCRLYILETNDSITFWTLKETKEYAKSIGANLIIKNKSGKIYDKILCN